MLSSWNTEIINNIIIIIIYWKANVHFVFYVLKALGRANNPILCRYPVFTCTSYLRSRVLGVQARADWYADGRGFDPHVGCDLWLWPFLFVKMVMDLNGIYRYKIENTNITIIVLTELQLLYHYDYSVYAKMGHKLLKKKVLAKLQCFPFERPFVQSW